MSLLLALAACGSSVPGNFVQLDWAAGDTFHVGATYRIANVKTEEVPVDLDGGEQPFLEENWTEEITWTFQVIEQGNVPDSSDDLYPYAVTEDGREVALDVVRAWVDPALNDDPEMLESDPVVYMVFRSERDRLAAIIQFVNRDGERIEQAWSTQELGRSYSALSQSMLTAAPTYLAPFATAYEEGEKTLENGSLLTTLSDGESVDAYYDDEVGGGLVMSRYEEGQPWPTYTSTDNVEAVLLSGDDVTARRVARGAMMMPTEPEDFDYRAALASSIDIDTAMILDEATMTGGYTASVGEGYRPWAGSWWPLSKAELVFGYETYRETYSGRIKDDIDPHKEAMDNLSKEMRDMEDGADKDAKSAEYKQERSDLITKLVDFYGGMLSDMDGGKLALSDGELKHTDGWSYDIDELSPMDKFAIELYLAGETSPNPFYLPAWEILNSYNPIGGTWWGHCNGWAAAAILTNEPTASLSSTWNGEAVEYTSADLKGLMTESHYSTYSRFYGKRYYKEGDDITDLTPAAFTKLVTFYIRDQGVPLVFDTTASDAVWNFPAWKVDLVTDETTPEGQEDLVNVNTADAATLDSLPGIGESKAYGIIEHRETYGPFQTIDELDDVWGIGSSTLEGMRSSVTVTPIERTFDVVAEVTFTTDAVDEDFVDSGSEPESFTETWSYTLVTDAEGMVLRGTWDVEDSHPDFAWVPYNNPRTASNGSSENPYLPYGELLELMGDGYERQ
jgi:competence ComEA-like helix-hairpin-helix protein